MMISPRLILAVLSSIFLFSGAAYLISRIRASQSSPALGSRIIFLAVDLIGLLAFIVDGNRDFIGASVLLVSIITTSSVSLTIIYRDGFRVALQTFERYYLAGAGLVLVFWFLTDNAFVAFVLTQVLVVMGYVPLIQKMFTFRRNTESTGAWTLFLVSYLFGSYPAYTAWTQHHEILSLIYVLRGIACMGAVLGVGLYFDWCSETNTPVDLPGRATE